MNIYPFTTGATAVGVTKLHLGCVHIYKLIL